jgi:hypothetical protein
MAALKSHKILYIGAPWPQGLQKRLNSFIVALKSHEITLHWYGGRSWAGLASELKKNLPPMGGQGTGWVNVTQTDSVMTIVLIDQQSVGKRSLHLMDTVNVKKRWTTMACQQFLTESHIVTRFANERASFLNMNDINDISFYGTSDCHHCCSIA